MEKHRKKVERTDKREIRIKIRENERMDKNIQTWKGGQQKVYWLFIRLPTLVI